MSNSMFPSIPFFAAKAAVFFAFVLLPFVSGCGDGGFPVRAAKGKVVSNGQPVTAGSITFSPIGESGKIESGKPATATIGPDGTFVLSTDNRFDGAVVGKHRVNYVGPEGEEEESEEEDASRPEGSPEERKRNAELIRQRRAQQKTQLVQKGEIIVEVLEDGENDFTIEIVPAGKK